jgi:flagellum-specific ATP synthase
LWSLYQQNIDLIQVGAYEAGSNPDLDEAIRLRQAMDSVFAPRHASGRGGAANP